MSTSLAKAVALFTGASGVGTVTQVLKGKLSAVFLGAEGVGVLSVLTNLWSLFSVAAQMGFYNGMLRHLAQPWSENDRDGFRAHMSSSTLFLMGTSLSLALLGGVFSKPLSDFVFQDRGARADMICLILVSIPIATMAQIYRAILNATRSVSHLVRARISADVASVAVLAILIVPFGLKGAIMGYIALHLLFFGFTLFYTRRAIGGDVILPTPSHFDWSEILKNVGFGIHALVIVALGISTVILVSRAIIGAQGPAENGIYMMAIKLATLYVGGLTASAGGYFLPTLVAAKADQEMHGIVDETLSFYLWFIPPLMVFLMAGGDLMMLVLFSQEFVPAAVLLLLILPADVLRITGETVSLPLTARKKLVLSSSQYVSWAVIYLALASCLLPLYGILGVALAYLLSQAFYGAFGLIAAWLALGYRMSFACLLTVLRALGLVGGTALLLWIFETRWIEYGLSAIMLIVWFSLSMLDSGFKSFVRKLVTKALRTLAAT